MDTNIQEMIDSEKRILQNFLSQVEELRNSSDDHNVYDGLQKNIMNKLQEIENLEFEMLEQQIAQEELEKTAPKKSPKVDKNSNNCHNDNQCQCELDSNSNSSSPNLVSVTATASGESKSTKSPDNSLSSDLVSMSDSNSARIINVNSPGRYKQEINYDMYMQIPVKFISDEKPVKQIQCRERTLSADSSTSQYRKSTGDQPYLIGPGTTPTSGNYNSQLSQHQPHRFDQSSISIENKTRNSNGGRPWSFASPNKLSSHSPAPSNGSNPSGQNFGPQNSAGKFTFSRNHIQSSSVRSRHSCTKSPSSSSRPLTRYMPHPSDPTFDLKLHIEMCGHNLPALEPHATLTSHSCYGALLKLSGTRIRFWKKKSFIFDRNRRVFAYYTGSASRKLKGLIPFDQIIEAYSVSAPSSSRLASFLGDTLGGSLINSNSSSRPDTGAECVFAVRLLDTWNRGPSQFKEELRLCAPSIEVKRLWMDVLFTGAEAYLKTMVASRNLALQR